MSSVDKPLDAAFGARVGKLYGVLCDAVAAVGTDDDKKKTAQQRFKRGLAAAREALTLAKQVAED